MIAQHLVLRPQELLRVWLPTRLETTNRRVDVLSFVREAMVGDLTRGDCSSTSFPFQRSWSGVI